MSGDFGWLSAFLATPWFGVFSGLVLQMYGVQRVKFWLPIHWSDFRRKRTIEAIGLALGTIPTYLILMAQCLPSYQIGWLAIMVGVAGPVAWKVFAAIVYKARPELEGTLSAHGRARRQRNGA